jgi:ATP-binding cassette subfamily G (WHITE) protein 2
MPLPGVQVVSANRSSEAQRFAEHYASSPVATANATAAACLLEKERVQPPTSRMRSMLGTLRSSPSTRATVTPSWWALKTLLKYRMRADYRDPMFVAPRIADKLVFALIITTLFW